MTLAADALAMLRSSLGDPDAEFHPGQLEAILALVEERRRVLVVERTGWGKSVVYFIATRLLRDGGAGPTILISPLLALMRDQERMAAALGVEAESISSANEDRWEEIEDALRADDVDLLMISPERLRNERFQSVVFPAIQGGIGTFVVDEAHCISDWGHDFRPDYRRIRTLTQNLPPTVPLLATTATANQRVVDDVAEQLGPDLKIVRGPLTRDSLHLQVVESRDQAERLAWLLEYLREATTAGIVYVLTQADATRVSRWLGDHGVDAPAYFSSDQVDRPQLERRLRDNDVDALVATVALGMGFDKPDLGFVVHFQRPSSPIAYYQQIGRGGRALDRAEVILLTGSEDDEIAEYFIAEAFPRQEAMEAVLAETEGEGGVTVPKIESDLNLRHSTIEDALTILEVEGAVGRDGGKRFRTVNRWEYPTERIEGVIAARREELARMQAFTETDECLMRFLTRELDDPAPEPCGRCANCAGPFVDTSVDPELLAEANRFLKRAYRPIEPRRQWKGGVEEFRGNIAIDQRMEEGRSLCSWGSAGWGDLVRAGKLGDEGFAEELVEAVAEMVESDLIPQPEPTWVTAVPSLRHDIVPDFAARLASRLGLPYRSALRKVRDSSPQKTMQNSAQQARNAIGSFALDEGADVSGPVLLVDDMVDSRWSLTTCAAVMLRAGSGPVFPIALADTGLRRS